MISFVAVERGTTLNSKEFPRRGSYNAPNILDLFWGLDNENVPINLRIGDWVLLMDKLYTVSRRIVIPSPYEGRGTIPFNILYIVWPMSMDEEGDEEE